MTSDASARRDAVDPARNVVLEASAGTGKTRVLVDRYVNLLLAGVDPHNILAITFTRKAAAEMRQRVIERLKAVGWQNLRDRIGDIEISTIDAFCLSLLREFPLDADVDPGFELADDTEVPRLIDEALDGALRICRTRAREDEDVALVFAELGERRLRAGLAALVDRRGVAPDLLHRYLAKGPKDLTAPRACQDAAIRLRRAFDTIPDGIDRFLDDGPIGRPAFAMLAADLRSLCGVSRPDLAGPASPAGLTRPALHPAEQAAFRVLVDRLRAYFLTQHGRARKRGFAGTGFTARDCASADAWKRHRSRAADIAPQVAEAVRAFSRDLNVVMARGVWRIYAVALDVYRRELEAHGRLDFSGVLERALDLLRQMDEFAQSRYRLEARYHHVLVDEFQDTSRAQWGLVAQLVLSWSEGLGAAGGPLAPSIFIVGDRKQSIYGFRDAEVAVLDEAAAFIDALRPEGRTRRAISQSFRAPAALLLFVNDVFGELDREEGPATLGRRDRFRYDEQDRFPIGSEGEVGSLPLGLVVGETVRETADAVADEVVQLMSSGTVRDRQTGAERPVRPGDVAVLFRSRESHREFESALERRGVPTYVYKGLGFFEADETQDVVALMRYLAEPMSDLRAAAFLRSRIVRLSDAGVMRLGPALAGAISSERVPDAWAGLSVEDQKVLTRVRGAVARWLTWVDRMTPADLLDAILRETAYHYELRGSRRLQARENLKKLRGLVRQVQSHGYATLARISEHLDRLAVGDESNAAVDAIDAVSLMTVHAAKGLEFPIVFLVNIGRGTGGFRRPIRVMADAANEPSVAIASYQSEADEDEQARDREETKRLLYVALTRARDRLYLSATVQAGACRTGPGSLGSVLPRSLVALIGQAGSEAGERFVTWTPSSGRAHEFLALT
ncbi:MAG: UvrD-helicase domain-containing protein [Vicinamibacterales bacterium]